QTFPSSGKNNGTLTVLGKGGDGGYTFELEGFKNSGWVANNGTYTFQNLGLEEYKLIVRDVYYSFGCSSEKTDIVMADFKAVFSGNEVVCPGTASFFNINISSKNDGDYVVVYKDSEGVEYTLQ